MTPTFAFIEKLHRLGVDRKTLANIGIGAKDRVDVVDEFFLFVLVDGVGRGLGGTTNDLLTGKVGRRLVLSLAQLGDDLNVEKSEYGVL